MRVLKTRVLSLIGLFMAAGAVLAPNPLSGQAGRSQVDEGNRLYSEGRFQEAYEAYLEALRESPGSPLIQFNQGNALYQNQEFQRAFESYQQAVENGDPALASAAWYNLGNSLYQAQQLEQSAEAYKEALRANPGDTDAKHNLERVLEQMQEQEENEDGEQEQESEDPEDEQDEEESEDPNDQQEDEQQEPPEDQQDENEDQQPPEDEQDQGQSEPQPRDQEMSQEEAERLLQAVQEDPDDVNRKPPQAVGQIPKKKW